MILNTIFTCISCGNNSSTNIRVSIISKDGSDATVKLEEYSLSSETQVFVRSNEESKISKKLITSLPLSITALL